jgi:AcrR family transcriptional regulator
MSAELRGTEAAIVNLNFEPVATTDGRLAGERGRQTRQRLLDATVELLSTTSWRSVKVTDIARQARTSPATFYQYFANVEEAIRVLAEGMVDEAAQLAELVGGDWSEGSSWDTARTVTEGFLAYWEDNRAVFRVVDLATEEGDRELRGIRVRALNAVTVALSQVILAACPSTGGAGRSTASPAGSDPMAVAGAHRHPGPAPALGRDRARGAGVARRRIRDGAARQAGGPGGPSPAPGYLSATGFRGDPSPAVSGNGVASSKKL